MLHCFELASSRLKSHGVADRIAERISLYFTFRVQKFSDQEAWTAVNRLLPRDATRPNVEPESTDPEPESI